MVCSRVRSLLLAVCVLLCIPGTAIWAGEPAPSEAVASAAVLAWNDLGMHCVDGNDYSIFSILPPFNNLHAQLVDPATGRRIETGVTLTYQSVADPGGSLNTSSAGKTNFWTWVQPLYGATLAPDMGLAGFAMARRAPQPMRWNPTRRWFEAEGIPITPFDDLGRRNTYPMVKVVARDLRGRLLGSAKVVLPVSDEMTCKECHASAVTGSSARLAARPPISGWAFDLDPEKDWKKNILRLHDDRRGGSLTFQNALSLRGYSVAGLAASAAAGHPVLCAGCHASNALPGTGVSGIAPLTQVTHALHAGVVDPQTDQTLDGITNRTACYKCHPGSETKCLRGAMGSAVDAGGKALLSCHNCHGDMRAVGSGNREGWLAQPNCQACHHDSARELSANLANGVLRRPRDRRFATDAGVPAKGFSLYRFSTGHGGLQCEACHGSTHAEYPSSHVNDNVFARGLQGYAGTLSKCSVCHRANPQAALGGPHGMHASNADWVGRHGDLVERSGAGACAYCHASGYRGSFLSTVREARSFRVEGRTVALAVGHAVGCYDCHDGPTGD